MNRISIVSGSLLPISPLSEDQLVAYEKAIWDTVIPGVDFDRLAERGEFRINQALETHEDKVNANNFGFVTKIAVLAKELAKHGISLKGELFLVTESRIEEPALQHISVRGENVIHTPGVASWAGKSTLVHT